MKEALQLLADNPALLVLAAGGVGTLVVWIVKATGHNADADAVKKWVWGAATGAVAYLLPLVSTGAAWTLNTWLGLVVAVVTASGLYQGKKQGVAAAKSVVKTLTG